MDEAWIERTTGGRVTRFERTSAGRSRGTWLVDVTAPDGSVQELVLRRDTGDGPLSGTEINLERESKVYLGLAGTDVLIPEFRAISDDGEAVLVERVRGTDDLTTLTDPADRTALGRSFIDAIATLHNTDVSTLDLPGFARPHDHGDDPLPDLALWTRIFEHNVTRPCPWVRFALDWLRRHAPVTDERVVLCHGDAGPGNFMFEGTDVVALLDWEFAHVGDPMDDVAWISIRAGHLAKADWHDVLLDRYTERTGIKIDPERVRYYQALVLVRMAICCLVALDGRAGAMDVSTHFNLLAALAVLTMPVVAERNATELEPPAPPYPSTPSRAGEVIDTLSSDLTTVVAPALVESAARGRARGMASLLMHLSALDGRGAAVARDEVADLSAVLGRPVTSVERGMAELDAQIVAGTAPDDATLIRYFWRMAAREIQLWPAMAALTDRPIPVVRAP